jgi:hypothetical protein
MKKKYICLNPLCNNCIDQVEFESEEEKAKCPECHLRNTGPVEMKKYQSPELLEKLKNMREEGKLLRANVIDPHSIKHAG